MAILLYLIILALIANLIVNLTFLRKILKAIVEITFITDMDREVAPYPDENAHGHSNTLSAYEEHRQEREAEFDDRIMKLKEELASTQPQQERPPSRAGILEEGISNLPHVGVETRYDLHPIEIAD